MIKRIFQASPSIASAAVVLGLAGLLSRLLGVYRDRLLATTFGAGSTLDAYYAAFRIPDFIFNLLVLGALSAGFIPVFSEFLQESKDKGWRLAYAVFYFLVAALVLICALLFVFAPWIMPLLTPGFAQETMTTTVLMTRIMLLSPIFLGISSVFGGVLQSFKRFVAYSLAPIFYNVGIIFGIFVFIKPFGVAGLAWGVVLGAVLHMIMQYLVSRQLGWRWTFFRFWREPGLKQVLQLMGPRTVALAVMQINLLIITIIASTLPEGRLTIFNFAQNLAHVPIGLFGISFAVAAFPVLSKQQANNEQSAFRQTLYKTATHVVFFLFPTLVIFGLLDEQIVRLVLGAGEFDWESTLLTARTLLFFIPGILAQSLIPLAARGFYAKKNTREPLYAAAAGLILNAVLGIFFAQAYGVAGLSFAFSLASLCQLLMLMVMLKLPGPELRKLTDEFWHIIMASMFMLIIMQLAKHFTGPYLDLLTVRGVLLHLLIPVLAGVFAYAFVLKIVQSQEYLQFESVLRGRIRRFSQAVLPVQGTGGPEDDFFDN